MTNIIFEVIIFIDMREKNTPATKDKFLFLRNRQVTFQLL
jgi:hypothetical protein